MKSPIITTLLIAINILFSCKKSPVASKKLETPILELLWETDTIFKTTKSCLYDPKHDLIYVSNTKENNGFISTINTDGELIKLDWATGMNDPKSMAYFNEVLYVTDMNTVLEIDPHTGKIVKKNTLDNTFILGDIVVNKLGVAYITAMDNGKIYTLEDGDFSVWKDHLNKPNDLLIKNNSLLVTSLGDGSFKSFDITTKKEQKVLATGLEKASSTVKLTSGNYVVSDSQGEIFYIKEEKTTSIYKTLEDKNSQAVNISNIPKKNIILIPTLHGNGVKAYKLKE